MNWVLNSIRENPELALFLTLAIGFLIGRIRIGSFQVGNVLGTLLAGVLVGQVGVQVAPQVKLVFFDLFLFATGYKVGPQFFRGLRTNALSQALLTLVLCLASLVTTVLAAKVLRYDSGTAAGLMAGAFTESTVIGTAGNTISRLPLPEEEKTRLLNNIPVAYAGSYLVGTSLVVWFLSGVAPKLLGVDLKAESRKLEGASSAAGDGQNRSASREWDMRTFRIPPSWGGRSVADIEASMLPTRVFVARLRRGREILEALPGTVLREGDVAVIAARRQVLLEASQPFGNEIHDPALLDFPLSSLNVVVTRSDCAEKTLAEIARDYGRGVVLLNLRRGGEEIPFGPGTVVNQGDLLNIVGPDNDVERAGKAVGYIERPSSETDVVFLGFGVLVGGLLGALTLQLGTLPLSLTASGGVLIIGLVLGWLRSLRPTFGRIPEPALWVFDTVGLAAFIGCVGLSAGPSFVNNLRVTGVGLVLASMFVALTPHVVTVLFGRHVLRMNPVLLLGACAGAGTITAALRAIQDEAGSKAPVLGYTVPYAIGNILLTAWGPVIVMLTR